MKDFGNPGAAVRQVLAGGAPKNAGGKGVPKSCSFCKLAGRLEEAVGHRRNKCPFKMTASDEEARDVADFGEAVECDEAHQPEPAEDDEDALTGQGLGASARESRPYNLDPEKQVCSSALYEDAMTRPIFMISTVRLDIGCPQDRCCVCQGAKVMPYGLKCCGGVEGACADCLHAAVYASVNEQRPPPKQADGRVVDITENQPLSILAEAKCPRCNNHCFSYDSGQGCGLIPGALRPLFGSRDEADAAYQFFLDAAQICSAYRKEVCALSIRSHPAPLLHLGRNPTPHSRRKLPISLTRRSWRRRWRMPGRLRRPERLRGGQVTRVRNTRTICDASEFTRTICDASEFTRTICDASEFTQSFPLVCLSARSADEYERKSGE
jgi:hypothetical protein